TEFSPPPTSRAKRRRSQGPPAAGCEARRGRRVPGRSVPAAAGSDPAQRAVHRLNGGPQLRRDDVGALVAPCRGAQPRLRLRGYGRPRSATNKVKSTNAANDATPYRNLRAAARRNRYRWTWVWISTQRLTVAHANSWDSSADLNVASKSW